MALTPPPAVPQRGDRVTFSSRVDAFLTWLANLIPQLNAFLASLTSMAAGGANSFSFIFDGAVLDADPTAGKLRLSATTQNEAGVLRLSTVTAGGVNIGAALTSLFGGTGGTKGSVRIQKVNDPSAWALYDVTAIAGTTYRNLTLVPRTSSSASPFADGDSVQVFIDRAGERGESGGDKKVATTPAPAGTVHTIDYLAGAYQVWSPPAGACTLNIINWPAAGINGELWIEGVNLGAATITTQVALDYLKPDGTYTTTTSMNANQGATLRTSGVDNVLIWGRAGAPKRAKVAR